MSKRYVMWGQFTPENCALILIDHQVGKQFQLQY